MVYQSPSKRKLRVRISLIVYKDYNYDIKIIKDNFFKNIFKYLLKAFNNNILYFSSYINETSYFSLNSINNNDSNNSLFMEFRSFEILILKDLHSVKSILQKNKVKIETTLIKWYTIQWKIWVQKHQITTICLLA
jgi:hypothetical protein